MATHTLKNDVQNRILKVLTPLWESTGKIAFLTGIHAYRLKRALVILNEEGFIDMMQKGNPAEPYSRQYWRLKTKGVSSSRERSAEPSLSHSLKGGVV